MTESGQLVTASFMDYTMPRARRFAVVQAVAIRPDALSGQSARRQGLRRGRRDIGAVRPPVIKRDHGRDRQQTKLEMPATPSRVWHAIHG